MSLTLNAAETLQAVAGTTTALTFTIFGDRITGTPAVDDFRVLAQGRVSTSAGAIYTAPASTQVLIKQAVFANTTASVVALTLYVNGSAAANQIASIPVPANGEAVLGDEGLKVFDANGSLMTTAALTLTGDVTGSGASPLATTIANDAVTNAKAANMAANTIKSNPTSGSADPQDLAVAASQFLARAAAGDLGLKTLTDFALSLLDDLDAAAARTTLGLGTAATQASTAFDAAGAASAAQAAAIAASQPLEATLTNLAAQDWSLDAIPVGTGANTLAQRTLAANQFLAKSSAGAVAAKSITDAGLAFAAAADAAAETALLNVATTALKGLQSAADKKKQDDVWFDIVAQGGADPLGVVDATTILQNAINTVAAAGGGVVFIPIGIYKITATITIAGNYVTVRGASRVASKLVPNFATGNIFTVSGIFNRFEYLRIEPASSTLRTAGYAFEFTSTASNCGCQWVDVLFQWSAVKATGQLCRLEDMNVRECGYGAINGQMVLIDSFTDQYINKLVCDNGVTPPNAPMAGFAGVRITNLSSLIMTDCQIIHCGNGLDVVPSGTNSIPSIYCANTFFDNGIIGANFTSAAGTINRCRFIQCWFSSASTAGVVLNCALLNGLDFVSCDFYGSPFGIDAQLAVDWAVRNSRLAGNTTAAIRTTAGANHSFTIADNHLGNSGGFGANGVGINVQAGTYKRYQILDNRGLDTNTNPGIIDLGVVGATDQKNVANNMGALLQGLIASQGATPLSVPITTETLVLTARVPANAVSVGMAFRIKVVAVTSAANVCTWRTRVGAVGTVAGDTVVADVVVTAAGFANGRSTYEGVLTVRSIGAPGSCQAEGHAITSTAANAAASAQTTAGVAATAAITTTAPWFIDVSLSQTVGTSLIQQALIEVV